MQRLISTMFLSILVSASLFSTTYISLLVVIPVLIHPASCAALTRPRPRTLETMTEVETYAAHKQSLPNCLGSVFLGWGVPLKDIRDLTLPIDPDRFYANKEYIACAPMPLKSLLFGSKCAFLQETLKPVSGKRVLEMLNNLVGLGCLHGGSYPINETSLDPSEGFLTVNYVIDWQTDCPWRLCLPNCGKKPCHMNAEKESRWNDMKGQEMDAEIEQMEVRRKMLEYGLAHSHA